MMVPSGYEQLWMLPKGFEGAFPTNGPFLGQVGKC